MDIGKIFTILTWVMQLVPLAEEFFSDHPGSGASKKEVVKTGVKTILKGVEEVSTGGQKKTWQKINSDPSTEDFIDSTIDLVADNLFG